MPAPILILNADRLNIGAVRFDHYSRCERIKRFFCRDNITKIACRISAR
jgi:hypothetical protein